MTLHVHRNPCQSCPYRKDVPSGVWHPDEYVKLLEYDKDTAEQPLAVFMCHSGDAEHTLCRGWLECHGDQLLSLRLALIRGQFTFDAIGVCDVEIFDTALEAAEHGMAEINNPSEKAHETISKVLQIKERRNGNR